MKLNYNNLILNNENILTWPLQEIVSLSTSAISFFQIPAATQKKNFSNQTLQLSPQNHRVH